jgi:hypothetical protein
VSGLSVAGNFASCSPLYACSTFPHTRPSNIKPTGSRSASTTSSQTFQTPSRPSLSLARLLSLRPRPRVPGARRTRRTRCTSTLVLHRASLRCSACCLLPVLLSPRRPSSLQGQYCVLFCVRLHVCYLPTLRLPPVCPPPQARVLVSPRQRLFVLLSSAAKAVCGLFSPPGPTSATYLT